MTAQLSVIIAYYRNEAFLRVLLEAFERQSKLNFELIIAEDDNTLNFDSLLTENYAFPIYHVSQEDKGFRKCRILNLAILKSSTERIVFVDGDCVPHKHFIEAYLALSEYNCVFGRRVMLSQKHSQLLLTGKSNYGLLALWRNGSKQVKHAIYFPWRTPNLSRNKGIWGCNWAIKKELLIEVNGFDEDYVLAGIGEDVDIEWRLRANGVKIYYAKHRPIVYHLHHKEHYNENIVNQNLRLLKRKEVEGKAYCVNGLNKSN